MRRKEKKEQTLELNPHKKSKKKLIIIAAAVFVATAAIVATILILVNQKPGEAEPEQVAPEPEPEPTVFYSVLSGEEIVRSGQQENGLKYSVEEASAIAENYNKEPTFCIQIPNGMDGARPQAGLNEAKVVFEAIAEAGITRFAAIFQGPKESAIGPVRSLRSYYLSWDVPFDCTIIHAGGEGNALKEVASYKHLSESNTYMWRTYGRWIGGRFAGYVAPNNLFTDATLLKRYNSDAKYTSSNVKAWPRLTPEESAAQKASEDENLTAATSIKVRYGNVPSFNPVYTYNPEKNVYARSYEDGSKHLYYICGENQNQPKPQENCGEAVQVEASVVVVMKVSEMLSPVNHYREVVETIGSGDAWVFQNGFVFPAKWEKKNKESQIVFTDKGSGEVISLAPGQTWISAIPAAYGSVSY